MGSEKEQPTEERKNTTTQNTYINLASVSYLVLQLLLATADVCSKERTARHDAAPQNEGQGTAPHCAALRCAALRCAALRCAAELYIAVAELSWGCIVFNNNVICANLVKY